MTDDGVTFGFFWPQWGVDFIAASNAIGTDAYGDFAVCEGPAPFYWGGTYICAASCTDNRSLIGKIMKRLTCDSKTLYELGKRNHTCVNNKTAMKKLANAKSLRSEFLKNQNPFAAYHNNAVKASGKNNSVYDYEINEAYQGFMTDYIRGNIEKEKALDNFFAFVRGKYPSLKI